MSDEMDEVIRRQMAASARSFAVDRDGWTRADWVADAKRLFEEPDGAVTSLLNGHVGALLAEIRAVTEERNRLQVAARAPSSLAALGASMRFNVGRPTDPSAAKMPNPGTPGSPRPADGSPVLLLPLDALPPDTRISGVPRVLALRLAGGLLRLSGWVETGSVRLRNFALRSKENAP